MEVRLIYQQTHPKDIIADTNPVDIDKTRNRKVKNETIWLMGKSIKNKRERLLVMM